MKRPLHAALIASALIGLAPAVALAQGLPFWAPGLARFVCERGSVAVMDVRASARTVGVDLADIAQTIDQPLAKRTEARLAGGGELDLTLRLPGTPGQRLRLQLTGAEGPDRRDLLLQLGRGCTIELARVLEYDTEGRPETLLRFEDGLDSIPITEPLNPPVPAGTDPGGVAVAQFDSGLNYTLPDFADRLARDQRGQALGHDFADDDDRPFDLDPSRPALFPIRHGTSVASVMLAEAPSIRLIPYRYPREIARFAEMVDRLAMTPARIVSMPLGGSDRAAWQPFADAARRHPEILFVVSAGNDGRDIDAEPVYPAAFDLDTVITVTSSDAFGKIAPGSNWGAQHVDLAVPAERIDVIDHRGARARASGSSYAVPRVAALAARLKAKNPEWDAAALKAAILKRSAPLRDRVKQTRHGWIPNPAIE